MTTKTDTSEASVVFIVESAEGRWVSAQAIRERTHLARQKVHHILDKLVRAGQVEESNGDRWQGGSAPRLVRWKQ